MIQSTKGKQKTNKYYLLASTNLQKKGFKIIEANEKVEHGLGRPQLIKIKDKYFIFYTRRKLDMKYFMGAASSKDLKKWD